MSLPLRENNEPKNFSLIPIETMEAEALEAEETLVSNLLFEPTLLSKIRFLKPEDFSSKVLSEYYRVMVEMETAGESVEPLTVVDRLKQSNVFEQYGGEEYLSSLLSGLLACNTTGAVQRARLIVEKSISRNTYTQVRQIADQMFRGSLPIPEAAETLRSVSEGIRNGLPLNTGDTSIRGAIAEREYEIEMMKTGQISRIGWPSCYMDKKAGCLLGRQVSYLIGNPGSKKSWLSLMIALNAAKTGPGAFILNTEMTRQQTLSRILAIMDKNSLLADDRMDPVELSELTRTVTEYYQSDLDNLRLEISENKPWKYTQALEILRDKARFFSLLVIDHLGGLTCDTGTVRSKFHDEEERFIKALLLLTKETGTHCLVISHFNRSSNEKGGMGSVSGSYNAMKHVQNVFSIVSVTERKADLICRQAGQKVEKEVNLLFHIEKVRGAGDSGRCIAFQWNKDTVQLEPQGVFLKWSKGTF